MKGYFEQINLSRRDSRTLWYCKTFLEVVYFKAAKFFLYRLSWLSELCWNKLELKLGLNWKNVVETAFWALSGNIWQKLFSFKCELSPQNQCVFAKKEQKPFGCQNYWSWEDVTNPLRYFRTPLTNPPLTDYENLETVGKNFQKNVFCQFTSLHAITSHKIMNDLKEPLWTKISQSNTYLCKYWYSVWCNCFHRSKLIFGGSWNKRIL